MTIRSTIVMGASGLLAAGAVANPVNGTYFDVPNCDNHGILQAREELGTGPLFPADELIDAQATFTADPACIMSDDPLIPNALVVMTNLSGRDWTDLFYVGDPDVFFSNHDGEAESAAAPGVRGLAVKLDWGGVNRALVFESMVVDGVFQAGETWHFILQDYSDSTGIGPSFMGSLDFAGASSLAFDSTGSIVQFVVPSPGALAVLGLGGVLAGRRRR